MLLIFFYFEFYLPNHHPCVKILFYQGARDSLKCGVSIGRCELLDDHMVSIVNTMNFEGDEKWEVKNTLLYEINGNN